MQVLGLNSSVKQTTPSNNRKLFPLTAVKSPLRYPGGKSRAVKEIYNLLPSGLDRMCSPFAGGASVELACAQQGIQVSAYDSFEPLVRFWQVLLDDAPDLARIVSDYYPLTRTEFYAIQKSFHEIENKKQQASAFYVLNRCSFSGTTLSGGMSPGHPRFTVGAIERLAAFKVNNFDVDLADFNDSIKKHDNDFLYLDPPYANGEKLYGDRGGHHANFNHQGLAKLLTNRDGWLLSYNDCEIVRDLYSNHQFLSPEWAYGMNNSKLSNEVLILSKDYTQRW